MKDKLVEYRSVIISVLICLFIISAVAVSIFFFVKADRLAEKANVTSMLSSETTSICETLKRCDGSLKSTAHLLRSQRAYTLAEESLTLYYDEDFRPASESTAAYRTVVTSKDHGGYVRCRLRTFTCDGSDDPVYDFSFRAVVEGVK